MSVDPRIMSALVSAVESAYQPGGRASSHVATVTRVDPDGTMWVSIPGGADETPVRTSLVSAAPGDVVMVEIANGSATATGNATSPAVGGDAVARAVEPVERKAESALDEAQRAHESADSAERDAARAATAAAGAESSAATAASAATSARGSAETAATAASQAQGSAATAASAAATAQSEASTARASAQQAVSDAADAKSAAQAANRSANGAVTGLATVQQVVDQLGVDVGDLQAHVALMDAYGDGHGGTVPAGLHVVLDQQGYFLVVANDGVYVYDGESNLVTTFGESIDFSSSRPQRIGGEDAYVEWYDSDSDGTPDALRIVGASITLGGNVKPVTASGSEWATHTSATSATGISGWSDSFVAPTTAKPYVWTRTWTVTDGQRQYGSPACISGAKGDTGATGPQGPAGTSVTVASIQYGTSASASTQPTSWGTTAPTSIARGKWLWVKTNYSNGTSAVTKSYVGTDGEDGKSVAVQSATKSDGTTTIVLADTEGHTTTLTIEDGADGQNGQPGTNGLSGYVHTAWATSADGSEGFSTSVSTGKTYLGVYTDNTAADSTSYQDYSWSLIKGTDGTNGSDGVGISSTTIRYGASGSATTEPTSWQDSVPTVGKGQWLWVETTYAYTDGTRKTVYSKSYAGTDGEDGKSVAIQSVTKKNGVTTLVLTDGGTTKTLTISDGEDGATGQRGPAGADGESTYIHTAWANSQDGSTDFSTTASEGKGYLGVCTDSNAADPTTPSSYSWSRIEGEQGPRGPQGEKGDTPAITASKSGGTTTIRADGTSIATISDGTSVTVSKTEYQAGASATTAPTGTWSTSVPSVAEGGCLWTRVTYSDGKVAYSVARQGVSGSDGTSVTVASTACAYQLSTSGTAVPTGTWQSSPQAPTATQYAWTRTTTTFSDGKSAVTYTVGGRVGDKGDAGQRGAVWYTGTGVTGTSTTATAFSGSGVGSAIVGDMYLNTSTGNTYRCTVAGAASAAKWVYVDNLTGPQGSTGAAGARGGLWYTGTACTHASGTAKSATGISAAVVGDMYMNTSTGLYYRCTTAGASGTAVWTYAGSARGAKGDAGVGVASYQQKWAKSTSDGTAPAASAFSATQPSELGAGEYLWVRVDTTWTDGNTTAGTPTVDRNASGLWHVTAGLAVGQTSIESTVRGMREELSNYTTSNGYALEVTSTAPDITADAPSVTLTATLYKDGEPLSSVPPGMAVKWYRGGAAVGTGLTYAATQRARYTCRLEG